MLYSENEKRILPLVFLAIVLVALILAIALRCRSEHIRSIPTSCIAIILLFFEIIKQRWNILGDFNHFYLPFHYCSLFLLFIPLSELCGKRLKRIFRPITACMAFSVSVGMYIYPLGMLGDISTIGVDFYRTHSFIFHHLLVLYCILIVALRLSDLHFRTAFIVGGIGALYNIAAVALSYKFNANYGNILVSRIPILEEFRISYGQAHYIVLLTVLLVFATMLGSALYIGIQKLIALCIHKKAKRQIE